MAMRTEPFVTSLRAELDAVVARYEAMVRAHQEALDAVSQEQLRALQARADVLERERTELVSALHAREAETARLQTRVAELERALAQSREAIEAERAASREAAARAASAADQAEQRAQRLQARLDEVAGLARMLDDVFDGERRFVAAYQRAVGTPFGEAVERAMGMPVTASPETFGAIKAKRADVLLTHAIQDRGARVTVNPLMDAERAAMQGMAEAAGCELIVPDVGTRYSSQGMEKAATLRDPAEEGNVVECMMPGLRLAGSAGALVFPKVKVGVG